MFTKRDLLRSAAMTSVAAMTAKLTPAIAQNKPARPSLLEAKDIAEEGFIYGLPIVMNYAVMYEYAVDRNSGQYKAPFNRSRTSPTSSLQGYGSRHAKQRHALFFVWLDLRAEPMVLSVPAVDEALLLGHALRRQHVQLRLYRQPRHGQRGR